MWRLLPYTRQRRDAEDRPIDSERTLSAFSGATDGVMGQCEVWMRDGQGSTHKHTKERPGQQPRWTPLQY